MKKTVSSILLASALLLGSIAPVVANADGTTGTTNGSVTFTKPEATTTPVDPDNPDKPATTKPVDNGGADPSGDLTFLYVTKTINFGTHATSTTGSQTFTAGTNTDAKEGDANDKTAGYISKTNFTGAGENPNFVTEVSDTRGSNAGWQVSLTADAFTDSAGNALTGAKLNFNAAEGLSVTNSAGSAANISQVNATAELGTADARPVYTAPKGAGAGSTAFQLDPNNITLSDIPANVVASAEGNTYSGNLNWTLASTPTA